MNHNNKMLKKYLFTYYDNFNHLKKLIKDIRRQNQIYFDVILWNENIKEFYDYFLDDEVEYDNNIIYYLDIGSSFGLLLLKIYLIEIINQNNIKFNDELSYKDLTELYRNLFKLINTISSDVVLKKLSYNKKLILFSLFSIFNISPFPYNDKILDKKIFNIS